MPDFSSLLNVYARPFFPTSNYHPFSLTKLPFEIAIDRLVKWKFPTKDQKRITPILEEWYSNSTLDSVLTKWEDNPCPSSNQLIPLNVLTYNVQGWGTRALEVMDLIFKVDSPVCVFTEVGELWNSFKVPHFTNFYQKGTNHSGGVMITIGKHLRATRIDTDIENTVIVDIHGLSEQIRVIGIYWPQGQFRNLKDLRPFLVKGTILTGDFNATSDEWGSQTTDRRGALLKKWIEENELTFIPTTFHSSKRSDRHIDLTFTNLNRVENETIFYGTSDHWPTVLSSQSVGFMSNGFFPLIDWTIYQTILVLLEDFWMNEQKKGTIDHWYQSYIRFLAALKCRLTRWKEKEKYRPSLPAYIVERLREVRQVRNKYYRERKTTGVGNEDLRVLLRNMTREVRNEIYNYRSARWSSFLSTIQGVHDKQESSFWSHLSKIFKPKTLPFSKLSVGTSIVSDEQEITKELYKYFRELSKAPEINPSNTHDIQIETEFKELLKLLTVSKEPGLVATSITEVSRFIKKMKGKKSSGIDQVSNFIIKLLPPTYIERLVVCFNLWLKEGRYPDFWKASKVLTLNKLKAGIPRCNQTRPISLLAAHSKLFEKVLLDRIRTWAEGNKLVPREQSGFRTNCLLPTRVLSIFQEVQNNLAANVPTLAIYVDYEKAFDLVWHSGLLVKLSRLGMPTSLLKIIHSWLGNRTAYIYYGQTKSEVFKVQVGLPQGSSLSPYIFVVYHSDLVDCLGAHSGHLFADDLCVLIRAPIQKSFKSLVKYLEIEGSKVCDRIADYSNRWKQPINVGKTVAQLFYSQIRKPTVDIYMLGQKISIVDSFKYLGFTWTSKLSLKPTVNRSLQNIQRALGKLKWLRSGRILSKSVLRSCFFAYVFPHFAWIFPFFPFLPTTHQEALRRKYRVALRLVHQAPHVRSADLFTFTREEPLDNYVKRYISKSLKKMYSSDLGSSLFFEDIFFWETFHKQTNDGVGHLFNLKRVKRLKMKHRTLLLDWLDFNEKGDNRMMGKEGHLIPIL
jgi:endonuclease/exonuclease/phosphatase (EEP) superfamily protein YafD